MLARNQSIPKSCDYPPTQGGTSGSRWYFRRKLSLAHSLPCTGSDHQAMLARNQSSTERNHAIILQLKVILPAQAFARSLSPLRQPSLRWRGRSLPIELPCLVSCETSLSAVQAIACSRAMRRSLKCEPLLTRALPRSFQRAGARCRVAQPLEAYNK